MNVHVVFGRAFNMYQGWSEIVSFHLDRALGWNRKPPLSGRFVSSKVNIQ